MATMAPNGSESKTTFFSLPYELRTAIYSYAFGSGKATFLTSRIDSDELLPHPERCFQQYTSPRNVQLLRVCKTILQEARPILYKQTSFHVMSQVFAGKLPSTFASRALPASEDDDSDNGSVEVSAEHPFASHVRHLIYQVDCDMFKHLYVEDLAMRASDFQALETLEIRARAETWRDSFLGEDCDREKFVKGRASMLVYGGVLKALMMGEGQEARQVDLIEDRAFLGSGCVRLRLTRSRVVARKAILKENEMLIV